MDLTEQDLAAVVAVTSVRAVAAATGLPAGYLAVLVAGNQPRPEYERYGCPRCGWPATTRYQPGQQCMYCDREDRNEQVAAARNVLACGLTGDAAISELEDAGHTHSTARKLLTAARRPHA